MKALVSFFEIPATDFDRAVRFYETMFNIKLSVMDGGPNKTAFFPVENGECPGAISWASTVSFLPSQDGVFVSLRIRDMEKAIASIEENGGKILIPRTRMEGEISGYYAVFIDCEGNRLGLYSDE